MKRIIITLWAMLSFCLCSFANFYSMYDGYKLYHPQKGIYDIYIWDIDTVINEYTYYKVNTKNHAIRKEDSKVYLYSYELEKEFLVLDMGLQVGDNVSMPNGSVMKVTDVRDTTLVVNSDWTEKKTRKSIYLQNIQEPYNTDVWIDSIGSLTYGLFPEIDFEKQKLLSNDEFVFTFNENNISRNILVEVGEIYSNPDEETLPKEEIITNISVDDDTLKISGYMFAYGSGNWGVFVEEKKGDININYYNTEPLYDTPQLSSFNISLTGFTQDYYDVYLGNYSRKYIGTIYFGKSGINNNEIDGTTLTLHRQGDVLMAVFSATTTCDAITLYDTTGRVVVAQPIGQGATTASIDITSLPKGIYIARLGNGNGVILTL